MLTFGFKIIICDKVITMIISCDRVYTIWCYKILIIYVSVDNANHVSSIPSEWMRAACVVVVNTRQGGQVRRPHQHELLPNRFARHQYQVYPYVCIAKGLVFHLLEWRRFWSSKWIGKIVYNNCFIIYWIADNFRGKETVCNWLIKSFLQESIFWCLINTIIHEIRLCLWVCLPYLQRLVKVMVYILIWLVSGERRH